MAGFRFALVLDGGEPADPPTFDTVLRTWRDGDEFLAGENLQRFRILGIAPITSDDDPPAETFDAFWLVEPVDN